MSWIGDPQDASHLFLEMWHFWSREAQAKPFSFATERHPGAFGGALIRYKCSSVVVPSILWCINCWCINFWYIYYIVVFVGSIHFFLGVSQSSLLPHRPSIFEQEDEDELRYHLLRSSRGSSSELYEHVRPLEPWGGCFLAAGGLSAISHATKPGRYRDLYFKWWLRRWGFTNGGGGVKRLKVRRMGG